MTTLVDPTSTPAGVRLCPLEQIADPGSHGFVLKLRAGYFHGFAVRVRGMVRGYVDRCPHAGVPLTRGVDDYLVKGGLIACHWHGALFRAQDGACVGGPCNGASLTPWPLAVEDGWVVTVGERPPGCSVDESMDDKISTGPNARPKHTPIAGTAPGIPDEALGPGESLPEPPTNEEVAEAKRALGG